MKLFAKLTGVLACLMLLSLPNLSLAQSSFDTFPLWDNSNGINAWGSNNTPTYGQSFTADASHAVLTGMTFALRGDDVTQNYRAYVFQWTGSDTTGAALFTSSSLFYDGSSAGFQNLSVPTGSLVLTPGQQYVAFFSAVGETGDVSAFWGFLGSDLTGADGLAGGNFVFNNSGGFSGGWEDPTFFNGLPTADLAVQLTFSAVPEPTTWALIGLSMVGSTGLMYHRRKKSNLALNAKLRK